MKAKYLSLAGLIFPVALSAAEAAPESKSTYMSNGVFLVLIAVIFILALVIVGMAEMVKAGATQHRRREKEKTKSDSIKISALIVFFLAIGGNLFAQTDPATVTATAPFTYWGLGAIMFYCLIGAIVFELVIIYILFRTGLNLLKIDEEKPKTVADSFMESKIMKSITGNQTAEEEAAIMMDHEYDGIRELDNNLPGWWKYGFYLTIVVAIIYLFNYHVLGTGLSSAEEYEAEMKAAEEQIAEYKKSNANSVDESTVVQLMDAASISAGKGIYSTNCFMCHGAAGEGLVGPNLTDDYWLHKGSVVDVFKSIKYGWPDKGMKAWEQDLKPIEIQQVTSYILSLRGTNPANAKTSEGEFYGENKPAGDSGVKDSVNIAPIDTAQQLK